MPPRTSANLVNYKETCAAVVERANEMCEVMLDRNGDACSRLPKVKRCARSITKDQARYINFLHKETRNGKSQAWVNSPDSIIYGCDTHHIQEEATGIRVEGTDYESGELTYIPEE